MGALSAEQEATYWDDFKVVGKLFGLRSGDMPPTVADYRREMLEGDRLHVTPWARKRVPWSRDRC